MHPTTEYPTCSHNFSPKKDSFQSTCYSQCPVSAIRLAMLCLAEVSKPSQQSAPETTTGGRGALPLPFLAFLELASS